MKIMKLFNDPAMGFFSIGALFGLLLCMRSEGLHVLNIVMWVVAGLFLLLFLVRMFVLLFGKEARFLAMKDSGTGLERFAFPAILLLFTVEFYCRENMTAAVVALILFVLSLLGTILLAIKDSSESRNQPEK